MKRRSFLSGAASGLLALLAPGVQARVVGGSRRYLRPPGALEGRAFLDQCIRFFGVESGLEQLGTPYIIPREQACILCMKCGDACPTGAIRDIARTAEDILSQVDMGQARVDENLCLSYQGKTCGVCYRACPLQDIAIRVARLEQPVVSAACVGCGLCERSCIQIPQAIRVIPSGA